jgi:hypothetical protein
MMLMEDEKMAHSNAWGTHCEVTDGLKKSHGKINSLLLRQCTQVLIDKMKQDLNGGMVSDSFDPLAPFQVDQEVVLKQSDNQYMMAVLIAKQIK